MTDVIVQNLKDFRIGGNPEVLPKGNDISRFKDPSANRVVAPALRHIVYTLKDASKLRIVQLAGGSQGGPAGSQSFDRHSAPVKAVHFMNQKSNIVASFSDKELIVWVIPAVVASGATASPATEAAAADAAAPAASLVYSAQSVTALAWITPRDAAVASATGLADLVVTTAEGNIVLIPVASLHHSNMQDESGTVRSAPKSAVVVKATDCKVLSSELGPNAGGAAFRGLIAEASPAIVASADGGKAAVVCRPSGAATKWQPFEGSDQPIVDITVLNAPRPNAVAIASASSITIWDVVLDVPVKLLTIASPLAIFKATATNTRLVLVLGDASDRTKVSFAAVAFGSKARPGGSTLEVRGMTVRNFEMDGVPFVPSLCTITSNAASDDPFITMDNGKSISIYSLPSFYTKPQQQQQQQQQQAPAYSAAVAGGALPAPRSATAGGGASPVAFSAPANYGSFSYSNNNSLNFKLSENQMAFDDALRPMNQRLTLKANTVTTKLSDLQFVLPEDHSLLLDNVLNEQRDVIVNAVNAAVKREFDNLKAGGALSGGNNKNSSSSSNNNAGGFQLDEERSAEISEMVIRGVTDAIVENVARGISEALNQSLAKRVDGLVSTAINRYVKRIRKSQEKDGNKQAEAIAADVLAAAQKEVENKNKDAGMQLLLQLQQLNKPASDTLQRMQAIIDQQQRFIAKFTSSGVLEEVKRLRAEVASLRGAGAGGDNTSGSSGAAPNKATILARARMAIDGGHANQALSWVLPLEDPQLTLALLANINADKFSDIVDDEADGVPAEKWVRVATDLTHITDVEKLEVCLRILLELTTANKLALTTNPRVKQVLLHYVGFWKEHDVPAAVRTQLRDLQVSLK